MQRLSGTAPVAARLAWRSMTLHGQLTKGAGQEILPATLRHPARAVGRHPPPHRDGSVTARVSGQERQAQRPVRPAFGQVRQEQTPRQRDAVRPAPGVTRGHCSDARRTAYRASSHGVTDAVRPDCRCSAIALPAHGNLPLMAGTGDTGDHARAVRRAPGEAALADFPPRHALSAIVSLFLRQSSD
jgi:hypothetical protein